MGFATKGFVLVQLSVLLLSCFTVFGNFPQPPVHPPSHPPIHPPSHEPAHPPIHPPAQPPHHHRYPHHKHGHPPSPSPVHPPVHSPSHPPAHPPSVAPAPHHHGNHPHHHGHPPSHSPAHPPVHPPVKSPVHPPVKAPAHPPVKPPAHPPVKAPAHPPVKPPTPPPALPPVRRPVYPPVHHFPRSFIAVEGVVYCKSCKYAGVDTLSGASPLSGATVKLQCNNTKYPAVETGKTDKNGYFFITAPKGVTSYAAHKCKVFLVSSPVATCSKLSNFNDGLKGSFLRPEKPYVANKLPFVLYSVGPFAFEPTCPR